MKKTAPAQDSSLGALLVRDQIISAHALEQVLREVRHSGGSFLARISDIGGIEPSQLAEHFSKMFEVPYMDFGVFEPPDRSVLRLLDRDYCLANDLVPIALADNSTSLIVAVADPSNIPVIDEIRFKTGLNITIVVSARDEIQQAIERFYSADIDIDKLTAQMADEVGDVQIAEAPLDSVDLRNLERSAEDAPIVRIVNLILLGGIQRGASDIHVESFEQSCRVRLRVDGVLYEFMKLPLHTRSAVISRLKVISKLDIAERRMPQDGRLKIKAQNGREIEFRVSVIPCRHGEGVVMRILDKQNLQTDMTRLGFETGEIGTFMEAIHKPNGIVLVTGPTGSGKTTTLYSALTELNRVTDKILTAEDPIEYELVGINQVQINSDIGLTFAHVLRSFLRQDPDIIMVGEIRDFETAEMVIKSAQTGHLVLSTLHTNDAPSAITRLIDIGIEPFLLTDTMNLIVAQRLVRRVCKECCQPSVYTKDRCIRAGMSEDEYATAHPMKGVGCNNCNKTGFKGRVAVYELLPFSQTVCEAVAQRFSAGEIKQLAIEAGMRTLRCSGLHKFAEGLTTLEEVERVTRAD